MGDMYLTADRRSELVQLLDDPERLQAEYPKVAEYLELSPHLAGTGNTQADAGFELRFIHYMTDVESSENPYWEIVKPLVSERNGRRVLDGDNPEGSPRLAFAQMILQETFAYALPSPATVSWIANYSAGRRILEVGAGRGYWAAQLSSKGIEVEAFDLQPPDSTDNPSFPKKGKHQQTWFEIQELNRLDHQYRDDTESILLLCWPPGWDNDMASENLQRFESRNGTRLIYIGEPKGGKTANESFFSALSAHWELESIDSQYVSWWNLSDHAQVWTRKS